MKITSFRAIPQFTQEGSYEPDYSLDAAIKKLDQYVVEMGLILDPDFQRLHVWNEEQQIAWVEFFLRGGKSGRVIYMNHPGWMHDWKGEFVLVDGKQRIQAARRFLNNEIKVFGSYFSDFTDKMPFTSTTVKLHVNKLKTRAQVVQWYIEMNAGGTPHTVEEIAKAQAILDKIKA